MNQRIEELKHLASVWCDENIPEQFSEETLGYGKAWEDKFAELIALECAQLAMIEHYREKPINFVEQAYKRGCDDTASTISRLIRKTFGVE